jgi:TonB family protein
MRNSHLSHTLIMVCAVCTLSLASASAVGAADRPMRDICSQHAVPIGYSPAAGIAKPLPYYPPGDLIRESEGWALLGYTIAADGSTRDITVLDRMGSDKVLTASVDALAKWRYKPAQYGGRAVAEHGNTLEITYRFDADATAVVHDIFTQKYNYGRALLRNKKPREAIAALESAFEHPLVLHEQTMLSYLLAIAHWSVGEAPRALQYIRHATIEDSNYLELKARPAARRQQLVLEAKDSNFEFVVCQGPLALKGAGEDSEIAGEAARIVASVKAALADPAPLAIEGTLAANPWLPQSQAKWEHPLLRRKFAFDSIKGAVSNLRLTCTTQIVESPVNETSQWSVPDSAGRCVLRVFGEPGATFRLIEEW